VELALGVGAEELGDEEDEVSMAVIHQRLDIVPHQPYSLLRSYRLLAFPVFMNNRDVRR